MRVTCQLGARGVGIPAGLYPIPKGEAFAWTRTQKELGQVPKYRASANLRPFPAAPAATMLPSLA
jgi:hypothetical protein